MIGLCRGLLAYTTTPYSMGQYNPVSRDEAERYPFSYPISRYYYQLIDRCPLRMSREGQ